MACARLCWRRCIGLPFPSNTRRLRAPMKGLRLKGALLALACSAISLYSAERAYDLVIRNGKIVDGSGNPWFQGSVAIKDDRIVAIGRVTGTGKREIDATNLVIAPGFIDMHSHSDFVLF